MAPWVFAAPTIAFALLPSIVSIGHADAVAATAAITSLTALAGVAIQPVARRLETNPPTRARHGAGAMLGLLVLAGGLVLAALTADIGDPWLLVPCAIVLGSAYGLCLVAGLMEVGAWHPTARWPQQQPRPPPAANRENLLAETKPDPQSRPVAGAPRRACPDRRQAP